MSTTIRPSISASRKYWISKERFYELKHFCLQYPEWKKLYSEMSKADYPSITVGGRFGSSVTDRTADIALELYSLKKKMTMVEEAAKKADVLIYEYIFKAVTENRSYVYLDTMLHIPCGKDLFYDRYRKFFWLLSLERD